MDYEPKIIINKGEDKMLNQLIVVFSTGKFGHCKFTEFEQMSNNVCMSMRHLLQIYWLVL